MSNDNTHEARMARIKFSEDNPAKDVFKEVGRRVKQRMSADSKLSIKDATRMVFLADEDLHREYLDGVPPLHHNR